MHYRLEIGCKYKHKQSEIQILVNILSFINIILYNIMCSL